MPCRKLISVLILIFFFSINLSAANIVIVPDIVFFFINSYHNLENYFAIPENNRENIVIYLDMSPLYRNYFGYDFRENVCTELLKIVKPDFVIKIDDIEHNNSHEYLYRTNFFCNFPIESFNNNKAIDLKDNCLFIEINNNFFYNLKIRINGKKYKFFQPAVLKITPSNEKCYLRENIAYSQMYVPYEIKNVFAKRINKILKNQLINKKTFTIDRILKSVCVYNLADSIIIPKFNVNTKILSLEKLNINYQDVFNLFHKKDFKLVKIKLNRTELMKIIWKYDLLSFHLNNYKRDDIKVILPEKFLYNLKLKFEANRVKTSFIQSLLIMLRSNKF